MCVHAHRIMQDAHFLRAVTQVQLVTESHHICLAQMSTVAQSYICKKASCLVYGWMECRITYECPVCQVIVL